MTEPTSMPQGLIQLMDHSLDFVEILGADGVVEGVSAAFQRLSGYGPRDFVGRQYKSLVHPEDQARAEEALSRALHGTEPETVKLRYRKKDGLWRTILASARSFLGDPAVHAVVVSTRDVTDQCELEAELVSANGRIAELREQLTGAVEMQRKYLAAELHDDVQQILFGLRMSMTASRRMPTDKLPPEAVEQWIRLVQTAVDHLHDLTVLLRKPVIDDHGLSAAMRSYVDALPLAPNQKVMFETDEKVGALAPNAALACFRIVQEGLGNAVQHSGARNVLVRLKSAADCLTVSIRDDGVGFDVKNACTHAANARRIGLSSMRERAASAGGRFEIKSSIGRGTRIRASFPSTG